MYFEGASGEEVVYRDIPTPLEGQISGKRTELIESLSNVDEELGERYRTFGVILEALKLTISYRIRFCIDAMETLAILL